MESKQQYGVSVSVYMNPLVSNMITYLEPSLFDV